MTPTKGPQVRIRLNKTESIQNPIQIMMLLLLAITGLEKTSCITYAYKQWLFHSGERAVAHGPLVFVLLSIMVVQNGKIKISFKRQFFFCFNFHSPVLE